MIRLAAVILMAAAVLFRCSFEAHAAPVFSDRVTSEEQAPSQPMLNAIAEAEGEVLDLRESSSEKGVRLTLAVQKIYEKPGGNFRFIAEAEWLENPFWELTDSFSISWSDGFHLYQHEAYMLENGADDTKTRDSLYYGPDYGSDGLGGVSAT